MNTQYLTGTFVLLGIGVAFFFLMFAIRNRADSDIAEGAFKGYDPGAGVLVYGCFTAFSGFLGFLFTALAIYNFIYGLVH